MRLPLAFHLYVMNKVWTDKKQTNKACGLESEIWSLTLEPTVCSCINLDHGLDCLCPLLKPWPPSISPLIPSDRLTLEADFCLRSVSGRKLQKNQVMLSGAWNFEYLTANTNTKLGGKVNMYLDWGRES